MTIVRVKFERIQLYHEPFELNIDVKDGEDLDVAIERNWVSGRIPGMAEARAVAQDIGTCEVVKQ